MIVNSPSCQAISFCAELSNETVNGDGSITAGDAGMAFEYVIGFETPDAEEACNADCNGDGTITAGDSWSIFMILFGEGGCIEGIE